jgi:hypothetical protein
VKLKSKLGKILSFGYLGLFALSGSYAIYLLVFHTANSEFCGLPAIQLTQPWSLMFGPVMDNLGIIQWYEQFSGSPVVYGLFAVLTLLPYALLNAALLYGFGWILDKTNEKGR